MLIEQDGPEWREKLPDIPLVPLSAQQHRREEPPSAEVLQARAEKAARDAGRFDAEATSSPSPEFFQNVTGGVVFRGYPQRFPVVCSKPEAAEPNQMR